MQPLVSIAIPSYRQERYVRRALDSCAASGYENVELVIVNDASPENDDAEIRAWLDEHPDMQSRYVRHAENRGLTRTLNECIDLCHGAYVAILAADDVLLPRSITSRVSYLENHPDKLAVFTDSEVIDDAGNLLFRSGIEELYPDRRMSRAALRNERLLPLELVFNWSVPGPAFMARRELYDVVGRYDETLAFEDWDMYLRIASAKKLGFLDECTAQYRWHTSNYVKELSVRRGNQDHFHVAARAARRFGGLAGLYLRGYSWPVHLTGRSGWNRIRRAFLARTAPHILRSYRAYRELYLFLSTLWSDAEYRETCGAAYTHDGGAYGCD